MKYLVNRETKEHLLYDGPVVDRRIVYRGKHEWYVIEADPEGWIKHDGDVNPLPDDVLCDFRFECGERTGATKALGRLWRNVTHYRPILDDKAEVVKDSLTADLINRLQSAHKAAAELPDIIQELREVLGPELMEMLMAKSKFTDKVKRYHEDFSSLAAQIKDPQAELEPDMADWRNWREGDLLKVEYLDGHPWEKSLKVGDLVTLDQEGSGVPYCVSRDGGRVALSVEQLRFHSRPAKEQGK